MWTMVAGSAGMLLASSDLCASGLHRRALGQWLCRWQHSPELTACSASISKKTRHALCLWQVISQGGPQCLKSACAA